MSTTDEELQTRLDELRAQTQGARDEMAAIRAELKRRRGPATPAREKQQEARRRKLAKLGPVLLEIEAMRNELFLRHRHDEAMAGAPMPARERPPEALRGKERAAFMAKALHKHKARMALWEKAEYDRLRVIVDLL